MLFQKAKFWVVGLYGIYFRFANYTCMKATPGVGKSDTAVSSGHCGCTAPEGLWYLKTAGFPVLRNSTKGSWYRYVNQHWQCSTAFVVLMSYLMSFLVLFVLTYWLTYFIYLLYLFTLLAYLFITTLLLYLFTYFALFTFFLTQFILLSLLSWVISVVE